MCFEYALSYAMQAANAQYNGLFSYNRVPEKRFVLFERACAKYCKNGQSVYLRIVSNQSFFYFTDVR